MTKTKPSSMTAPDDLLIYTKRRTRGLLAEIWEHEDEDRPHIQFTTTEKLTEHGVLNQKIWEEA